MHSWSFLSASKINCLFIVRSLDGWGTAALGNPKRDSSVRFDPLVGPLKAPNNLSSKVMIGNKRMQRESCTLDLE
jgi:hypothetical protein